MVTADSDNAVQRAHREESCVHNACSLAPDVILMEFPTHIKSLPCGYIASVEESTQRHCAYELPEVGKHEYTKKVIIQK